ncbi:uncharacterized protein LOC123547107 [Mercenaria mercenaria]|uniref:uncharacterized protein LOC123547107 n=1 Tax=Mercenaria mercenaria TaxID=6596 RepID=UPI00234F16CF|nr:uncharacterized protein LOC123547107 [Mercenaria mercenaria]
MIYLVVLVSLSTITSSEISSASSHGTFGRDFFVGILGPWQIIRSGNATLQITSENTTDTVNIHVPYLGINTRRRFVGHFEFSIPNLIIHGTNNTVYHRGIHVTTDIDVSLVVITSHNSDWNEARESYLIIPKSMISSSYIISSYTSGSFWNSNFLIVATENETVVNITINTESSLPMTVSMNNMDTYFYDSQKDLSGSIVKSNKPIAVFSGHEATAVPYDCYDKHFMAEQLLPISTFGREFIVPPMPPKSGYVVRVYGSEQNTTISYTLTLRNEKRQLRIPGQFHEILGEDKPLKIYASKPVQMVLYSTCYSFDSAYHIGGSTMAIIPATQQYANTYFFTVSPIFGNTDHYVAIMAKYRNIEDDLRINGKRFQENVQSNVMTFYKDTYIVSIYKIHVGVYKLEHVNGLRFGALQYGFGGNGKSYSNVLGLVTGADGLTCLQCNGISITKPCNRVTKCAPGQVCLIEKFITHYGQILYNMDCSDAKCTSTSRPGSTPVCQYCCDNDLCNSYCNVTNHVQPEVTVVG